MSVTALVNIDSSGLISIITAPFCFAVRGINDAGATSPVEPITRQISAFSALANDWEYVSGEIPSPKRKISVLIFHYQHGTGAEFFSDQIHQLYILTTLEAN
jgi:hypothetical protein